MRKFNGLRPQDVALLLKLVANPQRAWLGKDLAQALHLSASEVSEALARCRFSRLLAADPHALVVQRHALLDFLFYSLLYALAVQPGAPARGLATGASASPLRKTFGPEPAYVWPGAAGSQWGVAVDMMPIDPAILGFGNPWYAAGFAQAIPYTLLENSTIRLLSPVYFLCTKLVALRDRGWGELRLSQDLEDSVHLVANRLERDKPN